MANEHSSGPLNGVAIVGLAGRFPGAPTVEQFWQKLSAGIESVSFFGVEQHNAAGLSTLLADPNYVPARGVLDGVELFDAGFFDIAPGEAEVMDPQHRLFLECAWEALEHAGYDPDTYPGLIGVYAGSSLSTYLLSSLNNFSNPGAMESPGFYQTLLLNDKDYMPTRISYKLNLKGPSMAIQTACSTSLVAVHTACQSLLSGECDMALAGAVSVRVPQQVGYVYTEGGIHSPDGHCRPFDARAQGMVSGNGLGIVVLKRLEDALEDGDTIHAVIIASAVNNDGSVKVGYTAPGVEGQAKAIAQAIEMAEVDAESITYVEAHGTATPMGDSIEVAALTSVFRESTDKKGFCAIGSVKSNIGHLDTAAGMASLIKTVLALKHKRIPPSLHFENPNPQIDFADSPFYVNTELRPWETDAKPRRAGISAIGVGGTNAHLVVEEWSQEPSGASGRSPQLLLLSARTSGALETAAANLAHRLECDPDINLADASYTLQLGRRAFSHRQALVCRDVQDAVAMLRSADQTRMAAGRTDLAGRSVVFMFPGEGSEYAAMGYGLYQHEPAYRAVVDRCAAVLLEHLGLDLRTVLYPAPADREQAESRLRQLAQPALFVTEYALGRLLIDCGVAPKALIGYGVGEYVAACLAGVLDLEAALGLLAGRKDLRQEALRAPEIPCVSSVTGTWITPEQATNPAFWGQHSSQTAGFNQGLQAILENEDPVIMEVGPGHALTALVRDIGGLRATQRIVATMCAAADAQDDVACLLLALGALWTFGGMVNWLGLHRGKGKRRIPLPTYPFERQRYWIDPPIRTHSGPGR